MVNGGLLPALSSLASQQANPTEKTMELWTQCLDYMVTQEDAMLTYRASNMVLAIHSNTSYLSEPKSFRHMGGHMSMARKDDTLQQWCRPKYLANNPSSYAVCSGGTTGCPIHQRKNCRLDAPNNCGIQPSLTKHTNEN